MVSVSFHNSGRIVSSLTIVQQLPPRPQPQPQEGLRRASCSAPHNQWWDRPLRCRRNKPRQTRNTQEQPCHRQCITQSRISHALRQLSPTRCRCIVHLPPAQEPPKHPTQPQGHAPLVLCDARLGLYHHPVHLQRRLLVRQLSHRQPRHRRLRRQIYPDLPSATTRRAAFDRWWSHDEEYSTRRQLRPLRAGLHACYEQRTPTWQSQRTVHDGRQWGCPGTSHKEFGTRESPWCLRKQTDNTAFPLLRVDWIKALHMITVGRYQQEEKS